MSGSRRRLAPLLVPLILAAAAHPSLPLSPPAGTMASASAAAAPAYRAARDLSVRIVTYNVLSSHLSSPDHFTNLNPKHLEFEARVPRVLDKLDAEIASSSSSDPPRRAPVIFCLQEVSHSWAGYLHAFFANRGYHLITGLYGKKFNNYMGVALAYPLDSYETVFVDVVRLSDCREGGWPRAGGGGGGPLVRFAGGVGRMCSRLFTKTVGLLLSPARRVLRLPPPREFVDHWSVSEGRFNVLLTACLRSRDVCEEEEEEEEEEGGGSFCVSTYHMPCAFYAPMVMNIHAEMAARRCQELAGSDPHVLAGDFNILPDSPHYGLLTTGDIRGDDPTYPEPKFGVEWTNRIRGMRSAYAESDRGEPDFTNYARIGDDDPFIGTIDYIFISDEWTVTGAATVPHRDEAGGPFPNEYEPSDHVMIAADLLLPYSSSSSSSPRSGGSGGAGNGGGGELT